MSIVTTDAAGLCDAGRSSWRVAVRCIDGQLRRPPVVLGLAAAVALAVFVLATPRALPMLGGLAAAIAIGVAGPRLSLLGLRGRLGFAAERCRVGDSRGRLARGQPPRGGLGQLTRKMAPTASRGSLTERPSRPDQVRPGGPADALAKAAR